MLRTFIMRSPWSKRLFVIAVFLSSGRRVSCLDLRLDIAGGTCHNTTEFDDSFDTGVMPGTEEAMDITTETLKEEAIRKYGYTAFRGDDIENIDMQFHTELANQLQDLDLDRAKAEEGPTSRHGGGRDLFGSFGFDCPVFRECPGAGDPTHWCAWICGYWQRPHDSASSSERKDSSGGFLRRVTEDLRIPDAELAQLQLEPIRYTPQDRQLWISIERLVCGWIERWLDSGLSDCLHGATLITCELDLRS